MELRTSGVPAPAPHELRRERLLEVLHKHRARPLILLVAPAGFGKSTLAATYARDSGGAVAWLTLQAADRDSRRLFTRLADALDAGFGEADPGETEAGSVPGLRKGLAEGAEGVGLARLLLDDLAQAPAGFIIVLDDFQLVDESEEVVNAIDALIRELPEAGQIVITARGAPGLSMTRLVVEGAVFPLGTDDLRFTEGETKGLREKLGGDASHDFDAEGWVTGILLRGAPSQLGVAGASLLAGYVEDEILARLSPEEQLWLESLSIFDIITPRIAEAVFGPGPWPARLLGLSARCPFLVRGEDGSYRLHALIRETVYHRLRRSPDSRAFEAWSVARDLAEEASDAVGVVRACQELGDIDSAVDVLLRKAGDEVRSGRWSAVLLKLEPLPESVRRAHPQVSLIEARALLNTGKRERAQEVAEAALQHAVRSGEVSIQISALIELATASFASNLSAAEDWLSAAEHLLRTSPNLPAAQKRLLEGKACDVRGICSALSGDVAGAQEAFETGVRVLHALGPSRELALVQQNFGSFCNRIGEYNKAEQALAAAASHWRLMGDSIGRAGSQTIRGDLLLHLGNLDEAGAALSDAYAAAQSVGALRMEAWATESLGQWHRANGRIEEAIKAFEQSIGLAEQIVERELLTEVLVCRAEVALLQKDYDTARELLARAQAQGQQAGSNAALAAVDRALGRLHLEDGAGSRAIEHLKQALERAGDGWGPDQRAQTLYWLGTAYFDVDRAQLANNCLVQAVELVRKTNLPGLLAGPAAEAPRLLQAGRKLGVDPVILGEVERLAAIRQPWTGIEQDMGPKLASQNELPRIEVQLFDSFVLHRNGQLLQKTSRKINRAGELAALLILYPKGLSDATIAGMMYPDKPEHTAQHNLQMAVYALRHDLDSKVAIRYSAHMYQLSPELEVIADVREFDAALGDARGASGAALIEALSRAVDLYKGPLLANAGWDWLEPVRSDYQQRYVGAALQLADILSQTDVARSDALAANVVAAAPETDLAYERLLLNAAARHDANAVRRIRSRYEQAAARYGFNVNPHLGGGSPTRTRAAR